MRRTYTVSAWWYWFGVVCIAVAMLRGALIVLEGALELVMRLR